MDLSERGSASARHPWEIERYRAYRRILSDHGALDARRVVDVGAGDGWFGESLLADLPNVEQIVCWDVNYNELELVTTDPRLMRTTIAPRTGCDLVLVLDVLEHIADPAAFVEAELRPLAASGTPALVSVPAHPGLFGDHDRALGHFRRYTAEQLLAQVAPWIDVVDHGPLFPSLVGPRAASVAAERLRARSRRRGSPAADDTTPDDTTPDDTTHGVGAWDHGPTITRVVRAMLAADSGATRRLGSVGQRLTGLSHWVYGLTK